MNFNINVMDFASHSGCVLNSFTCTFDKVPEKEEIVEIGGSKYRVGHFFDDGFNTLEVELISNKKSKK